MFTLYGNGQEVCKGDDILQLVGWASMDYLTWHITHTITGVVVAEDTFELYCAREKLAEYC